LHQQIFDSGIGWALFHNSGIFDNVLPNLRFFDITTFGDLDIPLCTHKINDIGCVAAMAVTDERTMNKCVQMDFNILTQNEMLKLLQKNFPGRPFESHHYSKGFIVETRKNASNEISAKKGAETDSERWVINLVVYAKGKLASYTDDTIRTTKLYPDFQVIATPDQALADQKFVSEASWVYSLKTISTFLTSF
jgi:hypothetical protein